MTVLELEKKLELLKQEALEALSKADSAIALEDVKVSFLGQKGALTQVLRGLSLLAKEERPHIGQIANLVKESIQNNIDQKKEQIYAQEIELRLKSETIDVTLPGTGFKLGHLHPLTQITQDIVQILHGMGFSLVDGPEVETDYYNFDALNYLPDHPARDSQDTFYTNVGPEVLLRSQTSTIQIRAMEKQKPPLRILTAAFTAMKKLTPGNIRCFIN